MKRTSSSKLTQSRGYLTSREVDVTKKVLLAVMVGSLPGVWTWTEGQRGSALRCAALVIAALTAFTFTFTRIQTSVLPTGLHTAPRQQNKRWTEGVHLNSAKDTEFQMGGIVLRECKPEAHRIKNMSR